MDPCAALLRSEQRESRLAGAALLRERAQHIDHATFSQQRDAWTSSLLPLLQPSEEPVIRLSAAATLLQLLTSSAPWPLERRELNACVPRVLSALLSLPTDDGGGGAGLQLVLQLAREAPHALRPQHARLTELLPAVVMGPCARASRAAAALLGALPSCVAEAQYADVWLRTVQALTGSLQARAQPSPRGLLPAPSRPTLLGAP